MLSFLRSDVPRRTTTANDNPLVFKGHRGSKQVFHSPSAPYMMTHTMPPTTPGSPPNLAPPMHFHMYQKEEFHVVTGHARFHLEGQTHDREDDGVFVIPVGAYHRFENASRTEDLVIQVRLDEQNWMMEERFFRNFFSYLDDCVTGKIEPSVFQLLLFLHGADTPLAVSMPGPRWIGRWVSWLLMYLAGVIVGQYLLGYQTTYKEYYLGEEPQKKEL